MFELKSSLSYLKEVIRISELILKDEEFLEEISKIKAFNYTMDSGIQVAHRINMGGRAQVSTYKTFNPWSSVTASTVKSSIRFNTWNNPRSIVSMVNTLIHEWLHVIGYKHNGNAAKGNENSVPYLVGKIAEKYVAKYLVK